jgi:hypothetical protein
MAMLKGVEKVVEVEGFDMNFLKEIVKELNGSGAIDKPIKVVAVKKEVLVDAFLKAIESVSEGSDEEKKIPPQAIKLYNEYVEVIEDKRIALDAVVAPPAKSENQEGEKKEKKSVPKKDKGLTRVETFAMAIRTGGTKEELAKIGNDAYVKEGGKDNLKEAETVVAFGLKFLRALDLLEEKEPNKFSFKS